MILIVLHIVNTAGLTGPAIGASVAIALRPFVVVTALHACTLQAIHDYNHYLLANSI